MTPRLTACVILALAASTTLAQTQPATTTRTAITAEFNMNGDGINPGDRPTTVLGVADPATEPSTTKPIGVEPTTKTTTQPTQVDQTSITGGGALFPDATPAHVLNVTQKVFPAVVRIDVAQEVYENGKRTLRRGLGSGTIFDAQGHILTNYHVAGRGVEFFVTLANKERVKAKLIGDDHWTDLAVIQMDLAEIARKNFKFVYAELGTSKDLVPGQDVIAIGTPFGLARTLTLGVVSNTERTFYPQRQDIDDYETGEFSNWIQMDTPIAPGNSGGPLVNLDAKVVGVNTRGMQGQSLNFAIPIDSAKPVVEAILASAGEGKKGRVMRGYLGVDFRPLQDLEAFYEIDINKGALISTVDRNSPAAKAGLKAQDILLSIDGQPTNVRFPEELAAVKDRIAGLPIDKPVTIVYRRGGAEQTATIKVEKLESKVGEEKEFKSWGLSVRDVTRALALEGRLDDDRGVIVTSVTPGFTAARAEVNPGDVIREVDGKPVEDLEAFQAAYDAAAKGGKVFLEIKRGRGSLSKVLDLGDAK